MYMKNIVIHVSWVEQPLEMILSGKKYYRLRLDVTVLLLTM